MGDHEGSGRAGHQNWEEAAISGRTEVRVNDRIRVPMVRVIGADGDQLGVMAISEALRTARELDLDLVEVAAQARPPVCRIMDFGKYKYESAKREQKARKKQHQSVVKEVKLRPKIEEHDFDFKMKHARNFLMERDKVKVTVIFRGRELSHPELGYALLEDVIRALEDVANVEQRPSQDGRALVMMIAPKPGLKPLTKPGEEDEDAPLAELGPDGVGAEAPKKPTGPTPKKKAVLLPELEDELPE